MTLRDAVLVRPFERRDVAAVLALMRELAVFERYIAHFRVTEADLLEHGFGANPRFGVFVAEHGVTIVGIAVHYQIPWTFDLRPIVVLKELFVSETARGLGAGTALFDRLREHASDMGASAIRWTVLADNDAAKRFYTSVSGKRDAVWEPWQFTLPSPSAADASGVGDFQNK